MSELGLTVLDGKHLRAVDLSIPESDTAVTGAHVLDVAESRASSSLLGVSLPESIKSSAFQRLDFDGDAVSFRLAELDRDRASSLLKDYLTAIADQLQGMLLNCFFCSVWILRKCGKILCLISDLKCFCVITYLSSLTA